MIFYAFLLLAAVVLWWLLRRIGFPLEDGRRIVWFGGLMWAGTTACLGILLGAIADIPEAWFGAAAVGAMFGCVLFFLATVIMGINHLGSFGEQAALLRAHTTGEEPSRVKADHDLTLVFPTTESLEHAMSRLTDKVAVKFLRSTVPPDELDVFEDWSEVTAPTATHVIVPRAAWISRRRQEDRGHEVAARNPYQTIVVQPQGSEAGSAFVHTLALTHFTRRVLRVLREARNEPD